MPEKEKRLKVYIGRRRTRRGPLAYFYVDLAEALTDPDEAGRNAIGRNKPLVNNAKIGAVIEITYEGDSYWTSGPDAPKIIRYLPGEDKLLEVWSAEEKADVVIRSQEAEQERIAKEGKDPLQPHLDALQEALKRMGRDRRMAAIGYIIDTLYHGRGIR